MHSFLNEIIPEIPILYHYYLKELRIKRIIQGIIKPGYHGTKYFINTIYYRNLLFFYSIE
jgi:hypothetical protein